MLGCLQSLLVGSWDLVSKAISTLTLAISAYNCGYLIYNIETRSRDP